MMVVVASACSVLCDGGGGDISAALGHRFMRLTLPTLLSDINAVLSCTGV